MGLTAAERSSNPSLVAAETAASGGGESHNPFQKQWKTAKFTTTIGKDGKIEEGNLSKAVKSLKPFTGGAEDDLMMGDYTSEQQVLQVASSPTSTHGSKRSNGFGSALGSPVSEPNRGFTPMTDKESRSGGTSRSGGRLQTSSGVPEGGGGQSRGGLLSSGRSLSSQSQKEGVIRYGSSYTLMLRLTGEIYSRETIERLVAQCAENKITEYDIHHPHFLCPTYSQRHAFLPLLPKKYYDNDFIEEMNQLRTKARVNIAFLESRHGEFRFINQRISQLLVSNLLNSFEIEQFLGDVFEEVQPLPHRTIDNGTKNPDYLPLTAPREKINPFSAASEGRASG